MCITATTVPVVGIVHPRQDEPFKQGLVVVVGSVYRGDRLDYVREHWSNNESTVILSEVHNCPAYYVRRFSQVRAECFSAAPLTTRGEARFAAAYASRHGFRQITVVTTRDHVSRVRLRFARCWKGDLAVVAAPDSRLDLIRRLPYEATATFKAVVLERGC